MFSENAGKYKNGVPNAVPDNTSSSTGPFGGFVIVPGAATVVTGAKGIHLLKKPDLGVLDLEGALDCVAEELKLPEEPLRDGSGVVAGVA